MGWHEGIARPVSVETLGQRYRRYRLPIQRRKRRWRVRCVAGASWRR